MKPIRYITCTTSHISQAMNPENLILLPMEHTAWKREIVAMLPLSKYLKGSPCGLPGQSLLDLARCVLATLHGDLSHAGQALQGHHVADDEDLRTSRGE